MPAKGPNRSSRRAVAAATFVVFVVSLAGLIATLDDIGLTWDEPLYRHTELAVGRWFGRLAGARDSEDVRDALSRETLLEDWPVARVGLSWHPSMSFLVMAATRAGTHGWLGEYASLRLASALELAGAAAILCWFVGRRYGVSGGVVAAGSLVLMPRVFAHGHIAATDMPMLFFWAAAAIAFWQGYRTPAGRVLFAVLFGFCFLVKLPTIFLLLPIFAWLLLTGGAVADTTRPREDNEFVDSTDVNGVALAANGPLGPAALLTRTAFLILLVLPLVVALVEIRRVAAAMREHAVATLPEAATNYFKNIDLLEPGAASWLPGWILFVPLALWIGRGLLAWLVPRARRLVSGGAVFETATACFAWSPAVVLALCPLWWRDTMIRLGHYYDLFINRREALVDLEIFYLGQKYIYSLPWHNGWVLIAITVPVVTLALATAGSVRALRDAAVDSFPLYMLLQMAALPISRMFPTPGHGGVRLMLPTFFFLAALAGIGFAWFAETIVRRLADRPGGNRLAGAVAGLLAVVVLVPGAISLWRIHPYGLSYYNVLAGGLRRSLERGHEPTYWYDAVTVDTLAEMNRDLPRGAYVATVTQPTPTFDEYQELGLLRQDLTFEQSPSWDVYVALLTRSSSSNPIARLMYAMRPATARVEHNGVQLFAIYDPPARARAEALAILTGVISERAQEDQPLMAPAQYSAEVFDVAKTNPQAVLEAARLLASGEVYEPGRTFSPSVHRVLSAVFSTAPERQAMVRATVEAVNGVGPGIVEDAARMLISRPDEIERRIAAFGYLPVDAERGYMDEALRPAR